MPSFILLRKTLQWASRSGVPFVLLLIPLGCSANSHEFARPAAAHAKSAQAASASSAGVAFNEADLEAYARGLARETELVIEARRRANDAKTPAERANATQQEWEDQTIPGGAQAAGLSLDRYRSLRKTVNRVLETLDFQGKIDGPLELDVEHASPEMKQRLNSDPYDELDPASAAALRNSLNKLAPVWIHYMQLTAVNG